MAPYVGNTVRATPRRRAGRLGAAAVLCAALPAAAQAATVSVQIAGTADASSLGGSASEAYVLTYSYDSAEAPIGSGSGSGGTYAQYNVLGATLEIGGVSTSLIDPVLVVADDRSFVGGDSVALASSFSTTLSDPIFGESDVAFAFELMDEDFATLSGSDPLPSDASTFDGFTVLSTLLGPGGGPLESLVVSDFEVSAASVGAEVPLPAAWLLLASGVLAPLGPRMASAAGRRLRRA